MQTQRNVLFVPHAWCAHLRLAPSEDHLLPLCTALGVVGSQAQSQAFFRGVSDYVIAMDGYRFH
jgi:4,5-DOPA dioxygenase extradiol